MDNYCEDLSLGTDEILDAEWIYGSSGKKYIKFRASMKNDQRHVLITCYFYPRKPYGSYLCLCMSDDVCQKMFQGMQRYKKWGYKEMFPYFENSWPRFTRAIKNGWEKRSYDVCSLNKVHDFENPSRPYAWAFCKSLDWMPTLESLEDGPDDESDAEELSNALMSMVEELSTIDSEVQSGIKFKDRAMIELIRARNGLMAGIFLGGIRAIASDLPDFTSALIESNPEEIISFQD